QGNGFFILSDGVSQVYTRDGAFSLNQERKLIDPTTGMIVQGWIQSRDNEGKSYVNAGGGLTDIVIPVGDNRIAQATTKVVLNGNLNGAGDVGETGTILNSQRLFSSKTGDKEIDEISSSSHDLKDVWIKDPAGGVDNVRLFKGTGSSGTDSDVVEAGDQITVQVSRGGRPLEAIFPYGNPDLVNNTTGVLSSDGLPDAGLEAYDGDTLMDFLKWFDKAFGLVAIEDKGVSADSNAAHGIDGDNPNDLVDQGYPTANPFTDESDGSGFNMVLVSRGVSGLTGNSLSSTLTSPEMPKAGVIGSTTTYNILAGGTSNVGVSSSFVDVDGDGEYNRAKDIALKGIAGYVVTGNSTVSKGQLAAGSSNNDLVLKAFSASPSNGDDMYIDVDGDDAFDKDVDVMIKGAFSTDVFNNSMLAIANASATGVIQQITTVSSSNTNMVLVHNGTNLGISKGMFFDVDDDGAGAGVATRYTVTSVFETSSGNTQVTFDKAADAVNIPAVHASDTSADGVTFTSVLAGTAGNGVTINMVAPAVAGALGVSVVGNVITVNLASSDGTDVLSTINDVVAAINANAAASALVSASGSGATVLTVANGATEALTTAGGAQNQGGGGIDLPVIYQGGALIAAGYTATSSSTKGSTLITGLNLPVAQTDSSGNYQGKAISEHLLDEEKGMAGSMFINGDIKVRVEKAPTQVTFNSAAAGTTFTVASLAEAQSLRVGQSIVSAAGNVFRIESISSTVVTLDSAYTLGAAPANDFANASSITFNGLAYVDSDNDGQVSEQVFRVKNDLAGGASGTFFIDINRDGSSTSSTDFTFETSSTQTTLANYADNAIVYTDTSSGKVYRKVPLAFDPSERSVYLDSNKNKAFEEIRFDVVQAGDGVTTNIWVLDEDFDGKAGATDLTVISTKAFSDSTFTSEHATLNAPSAVLMSGGEAGSGRIQIRGNIGTANELSSISFISGSDKTERNVFQNSSLTNGSEMAASVQANANGESVTQNIVVYDSLGKSHDVAVTFVLESKDNDKAEWRWYAETADAAQKNGNFPANDPRGKTPGINVGSGVAIFDNFGRFLRNEPSPALISLPLEGQNTDSALQIAPDFSIVTSFANSAGSQIDVREQDGYAEGVMSRFTVDASGKVTGIYTNGLREVVAQIATAAFANVNGLVRIGGNSYDVGANSGNAMIGEAGTGERGTIRSQGLELSNVDITSEFTNMIITQRAYQANSRVIVKSDELLQDLIQIIR
ncbi:MAG: flagellar hook-basal body complex protein, partial [Planctomycetes bacterium]|nr:flagellar hook-basal body complex protein [Planctomycetota bacterium]